MGTEYFSQTLGTTESHCVCSWEQASYLSHLYGRGPDAAFIKAHAKMSVISKLVDHSSRGIGVVHCLEVACYVLWWL